MSFVLPVVAAHSYCPVVASTYHGPSQTGVNPRFSGIFVKNTSQTRLIESITLRVLWSRVLKMEKKLL